VTTIWSSDRTCPWRAIRQVIRSMLNAGLVEELPAATIDPAYVWRTGQDGEAFALRATALGLGRVAEGAGAAVKLVSAGTANEAPAEAGVPDGTDPEVPVTTLMPASRDNMASTTAPTGQGALERPDDANLGRRYRAGLDRGR